MPNSEDLTNLVAVLKEQKWHPLIFKEYTLDNSVEGLKEVLGGKCTGKVMVNTQ